MAKKKETEPRDGKAPTRKRRKKVEAASRGLPAAEAAAASLPEDLAVLARLVREDEGSLVGGYRDPLGGNWQLVVVLPIERVGPTPFQRDLSEAHVKRLADRIEGVGRFLDPIIVVRRPEGAYWTPNGHHRLAALRRIGARAVTALLIPEEAMMYRILALNTEKAHNLREKSLEVIRMARDLAAAEAGTEAEHAGLFEDPLLLTLGAAYEKKTRFAGSVYQSVLSRVEAFLETPLDRALVVREGRADRLIALDAAVQEAVKALEARGMESPYLKNFVVARINPIRFSKGAADWEETIDKMLAAARKFDPSKVKADQIARSGGPPAE
jgi:ParB family chromosome partitioning protein